MDYTCEKGAKRNFESWRDPESTELKETDEERLDRLEREEAEEAENAEKNAMEELEEKMEDSKREMQIADALDEIRTRNARIERGEKRGAKEEEALERVRDAELERREQQEREDEEAAKMAFETRQAENKGVDESVQLNGMASKAEEETLMMPPPPSFERVKKFKKPLVPGLVKKSELTPAVISVSKPVSLGLGDYDSDDD